MLTMQTYFATTKGCNPASIQLWYRGLLLNTDPEYDSRVGDVEGLVKAGHGVIVVTTNDQSINREIDGIWTLIVRP